eukprot:g726.t1
MPAGVVDTITSDTRNKDIAMKVDKATRAGAVTLLSREHGRGLDFSCRDKRVEEAGGLHVVQTFLSKTLAEEIQIRGRTARQKNQGSFQMVLLAADLVEFGVTAEEIKLKEKGVHVPAAGCGSASVAQDGGTSGEGGGGAGAAGTTEQTLYSFLHEKRALALEKSMGNRRKDVAEALEKHNQSVRLQQSLAQLKAVPTDSALRSRCIEILRGWQ